MASGWETKYRPLLEAVSFAGRAHRHQLRKDGQTPYVSHTFRACLVVRDVFGIDDPKVLMAAVLHDTIEDTTTDHDDVAERFGKEVADWVALLSKDKRLTEVEREKAYCEQLAAAPWQVKVCKLADIFDNLLDPIPTRPGQTTKAVRNAHRYLNALKPELPEEVRRPFTIVTELLTAVEAQEAGRATATH